MTLIIALSLLGIFMLSLMIKTFGTVSMQLDTSPVDKEPVRREAVENFAKALRINTTSYEDKSKINYGAFLQFHDLLEAAYPLIHHTLTLEKIADYSLLYTWKGSDKALKPIILLAHIDVVPVEVSTADLWTRGAFAGEQHEGFIYGRGTLDLKVSLIATMEAVEALIKQDIKPKRTVYLAFGHDEEIGGKEGALNLVKHLKDRHIDPLFVLDEGMIIADGLIPGIASPVALIGTSEKGNLTLDLVARSAAGHSSMPGPSTAIGNLSKAINKLESIQFPTRICTPIEGFIRFLGPEMNGLKKIAFANTWLFENLIAKSFLTTAGGNAIMRTTTSPTIVGGGSKANILPSEATATINFRLLPGDSVKSAISYVKKIINDPAIEIITKDNWMNEPSPESSYSSEAFFSIATSIKQIFNNVIIAPSLCVGVTDSRYYAALTDQVYRFLPVRLTKDDLARIHGVDERISIEHFEDMIRFYTQLIKNVNK